MIQGIQAVQGYYHYINYVIADKRISHWFWINSYGPVVFLTLCYLLFVLRYGPAYMRNRAPFKLKKVIFVYNFIQIICSAGLLWKVWFAGFHDGTLQFTCQEIKDDRFEHVEVAWLGLCLKIIDLLDTVFFVLRKKDSQISFLHLYHHVMMVWIWFLGIKYQFIGGMVAVPSLLNSFVHVFMYLYYLLSSFGPHVQEKLKVFKKYLTLMQMIQFVLIVLHFSQIYMPMCQSIKRWRNFGYFFIPNVLIFFILFFNFYRKSYTKKKTR